MMLKVRNVPAYALDCTWLVYRIFCGERWFWGAWNDYEAARKAAEEVRGVCVMTPLIDPA